jgi:exopolyphosphatase/guanosine-5'-triphosphate,3'-diphosphate pyrophosphatase
LNRIAVIDIGTNSILYLLAEKTDQGFIVPLEQHFHAARLGENVDSTENIQEKGLHYTYEILKEYIKTATLHNTESIIIIGTHVFRKAKNRDDILQKIQKETGFHVEVLTENEEAEWSFHGAVYDKNLNGDLLVCDIGGGSTEIITGRDNDKIEMKSIPMGAVSLTERFLQHDPPLKTEWSSMIKYINQQMDNNIKTFFKHGQKFISVGGTVTTLASIELGLKDYDPRSVNGYNLTLERIGKLIDRLMKVTIAEREKILCLDPKRADIIIAGSAILKVVMELGKFESVIVSDRGLRFGIVLREMLNMKLMN